MRKADRKTSRAGEAGSAAIEFGLFAPLLVILVIGVIEIGFAAYGAMQVQNAAQAGIIYAAKNGWDSAGIANAVVNAADTVGISASPPPSQFCGCPGASGVAVTACGATCPDGTTPGEYIRVNAALTRSSLFAESGFSLPSTLTAEAIMRRD